MKNSEKFIAVYEKLLRETKFEARRNYVLHIEIKQGEISAVKAVPFDAPPAPFEPPAFEKPQLTTNYLAEQHSCFINFIKPSNDADEFSLRIEKAIIQCLVEYTNLVHKVIEMCVKTSNNITALLPDFSGETKAS